jgi:SAM-dependent methyltransferase
MPRPVSPVRMKSDADYDSISDFGEIYDHVPAYAARADVGFYASEAARRAPSRGAVLDVGCGTGRLLLPLARAGHRVIGIDGSTSMLASCRAKLARESADVRSRAAAHEGDARDFTVPRASIDALVPDGIPFAIAPFRIFQHLLSIDDQLRALGAIRRHLAPGGYLAFDVFNPNFALMTTDRSAEAEDTPEFQLPDGRFFRRAARITRVRMVEQISDVELIYYLRAGDDVRRVVHAFEMRWFTSIELRHLLGRAAFTVEAMYGDFGRGPLRDDSPEIVVVARRD